MNLVLKAFRRPWLVLPYLVVKFGKYMDDETYIRLLYFLRNGKWLDLDRPVTYFEKINCYGLLVSFIARISYSEP